MRRREKLYVLQHLQDKLQGWLTAMYEESGHWKLPVTGKRPYLFGVLNYDTARRMHAMGKPIKHHEKRPDSICIKNYEADHYILVRKQERILTAILSWNPTEKKYQLFVGQDILALGHRYTNKTRWLYLITRRLLIKALTELALQTSGHYEKKSQKANNICIDYNGLETIFALIGKSVRDPENPKKDLPYYEAHRWVGLVRAAWIRFMSSSDRTTWGKPGDNKSTKQLQTEKRVTAAMDALLQKRNTF